MKGLSGIFLILWTCATVSGCSKSQPVDEKSWKQNFDDGYQAMQEKDYEKAESNYRDALGLAQSFRKGDLRLAKTLDALGAVYLAENKTADAKRVYTSAYNEYKALWKPKENSLDNRDYALGLSTSALHLANLAFDSLRLDDAERLYRDALEVEESALGSDSLKTQIYEGQAKLFKLTGRDSDAVKAQGNITQLKSLPSVDDTANMNWTSIKNAGNEAFQSGNLSKAEKLFGAGIKRATSQSEKADSMCGLAKVYDLRNEFGRATHLLAEAREILPRDDRVALANNLNTSGSVYFRANDYDRAEKMFIEAASLVRGSKRSTLELMRTSLEGLTKVSAERGRYVDAEKTAQRKLELTVQLHGKKDNRYAEDLLSIAALQAKQKKNAEARQSFESVIAQVEENLNPKYMLTALDSYSKFLRDTKQDALADSVELRLKNLRSEFE